VDAKQVGRERGVRYLVQGTVRKAAKRVRITAQLTEADAGINLSADRFEGTLDDIFDLQDQVAASVIAAITLNLERAEIARAKRKPTGNLDAYDLYLRGMASAYRWTKEAHSEALQLFYRAIDLDPDFAAAYGMAGAGLCLACDQRLDQRSRGRGRRSGPAIAASGRAGPG
jgi:hypothetical protein